MVDDTGKNDHAGASNPAPNQGNDPALEARIIEEFVVTPANAQKDTPPPPVAPLQPEVSATQPVVPSLKVLPPQPSKEMDMSSLLAGVKLPERRSTTPETPSKHVFDTSLSIDPEKQKEADAARAQAIITAQTTARTITEKLAEQKPKADIQPLHTLKDDLQNVVRDKKISLVRAVALEEEKRHHSAAIGEQLEVQKRRSERTHFGVFFVIILILLGMGALGAVLYVMGERAQKPPAQSSTQLLFAEQAAPLSVENVAAADVRREVALARNSALTLGAILQVVPVTTDPQTRTQAPISFSSFMNAIGAQPPAELLRALDAEFFFGIHTVDENAPLFVIPVLSYERAFAGMLEWEASMNRDLSPMFTEVSSQLVGQDGLINVRTFEDTVMRNYDVRALKDDSGTIQLYYSFPTRNILIIAESPYSFTEILTRLRADRRL